MHSEGRERAMGWNSGMGNRYVMEQQEGGIKGLPGYFAESSRDRLTHDTARELGTTSCGFHSDATPPRTALTVHASSADVLRNGSDFSVTLNHLGSLLKAQFSAPQIRQI